MANERLRISIDDKYVQALGRCAYVFAILEWNAVWCCQRIDQGYIPKLGKRMAGGIAADFVKLSVNVTDANVRAACAEPACEFERLVVIRNGIMHGKPGTGEGGAQRLFRDGQAWTSEAIDDAADQFATCSINLSSLLCGALASAL